MDSFRELSVHKGLTVESLKGDYKGFYSVRVDRSYRLIVTRDRTGNIEIREVISVHDLNNHYQ